MDIEFTDPAEAPLPPDRVSFRRVEVEPYQDAQRLLVRLSVTPFQERPTIDLEVLDKQGGEGGYQQYCGSNRPYHVADASPSPPFARNGVHPDRPATV